MELLITLCARGGSKGIPKKNIKLLNGVPLLLYSINLAKKIKNIFENTIIELSTDDLDILNLAKENGLHTSYLRPPLLASDSAGKVPTIEDLVLYSERHYNKSFDYILDLDISSPLRTLEDVLMAFESFVNNPESLTLFSVNIANKNPYFNLVEENSNGYYNLSKKLKSITLSRQTAPIVYELNASFYIYRRKFFEEGLVGVITDKSLIYEMKHICFDLDHQIDFDFMDYLLKNNKLDFTIL